MTYRDLVWLCVVTFVAGFLAAASDDLLGADAQRVQLGLTSVGFFLVGRRGGRQSDDPS